MSFITVFVLAAFVGYEVVSKVPSILHTPLMSGSNAIHGIILVGTMLVLGQAHGAAQLTLGFLAVVLATLNVVGGFVVTDRMLEMFKSKPVSRTTAGEGSERAGPQLPPGGAPAPSGGTPAPSAAPARSTPPGGSPHATTTDPPGETAPPGGTDPPEGPGGTAL
jgi:NAD(P) transhydrogenase subunit alpha